VAILNVKNISKSFGSTEVLKGVDFDLEAGETIAIIGSSGSGKTTLLRCLTFLEQPTTGTVSVKDNVIIDAAETAKLSDEIIRERRSHFGFVFQSFNLFPQYTALRNVTLAKELQAKELPGFKAERKTILQDIEKEGRELLDMMGLADRADYYPHQLSGGQQQRVAIARALALKPDILCCYEPTSALDPELTG